MESVKNFNAISIYCQEHWKKEVEMVLESADAVLENRFTFRMPWDMERTEEEASFPDGKINWYFKLNGDPEFVYQFNRHIYFQHLAQGFYLKKDRKYLDKLISLWENWLSNVPKEKSQTASPWRSLEVGMRSENWLKTLDLIGAELPQELKEKIDASLDLHAKVLMEEHKAFQVSSNWGVLQDTSLFLLGAYLHNDTYKDTASKRLTEETAMQVMADGVHWEQSCGYHNDVLFALLNVVYVGQKIGYSLDKGFVERVEKMATVNTKWIKPNGQHLLMGDSDNNVIHDIISRSAYIFKRGDFKYLGFPTLDYDSAWLFGEDGIKDYIALESVAPRYCNVCLEDSGHSILRSNWEKDANFLVMHNGYTGGGHAHADKLHFDLMLSGRDVLVDGGRYTYKNTAERRKIKDAEGHNTTIIDGKQFCKAVDPWGVIHPAIAVKNPMIENEYCALLSGGHLGYVSMCGVYPQRQILWIKPNIYLILDSYYGKGKHKYQQYYHFAPNGKVSVHENQVTFSDDKGNVKMCFLEDTIKTKLVSSMYSPNYNKVMENQALEICFKKRGNTFTQAVIFEENTENPIEVSKVPATLLATPGSACPATGIVIRTKDAEYTICIAHAEIKSTFVCNGKKATGNLVVYKEDEIIFKRW